MLKGDGIIDIEEESKEECPKPSGKLADLNGVFFLDILRQHLTTTSLKFFQVCVERKHKENSQEMLHI